MKLLIHPLIMPFYAFCLMCEMERQSYATDLSKTIYMTIFVFIVFVLFPFITKFQFSPKHPDGLWDIESDFRTRLQYALILSAGYLGLTWAVEEMGFFNTTGYKNIFTVFITPLVLNIFSGEGFRQCFPQKENFFLTKFNIAQPTFIGALSGFCLLIGYKAGTDTFWPFVISLLIFTLSAIYCIDKRQEKYQHHIYGLLFGCTQAAIILLLIK
ncbi:MAG: hypothetical protein IJ150_06140 [Bacteroidales bacterium]|nr:hypothetical protein [Bacteroidales bacterium]